ncbi:MAG: hypothetical protein ACFFCD_16970 [Promethearchaeota archaeon]
MAFVGICFSTFSITECPRRLHMLLIAQLSLMLFFTPFLLSGFSWSPDSLWHGGVPRYLPQILSGSEIKFSQYAASYPFSFLTTYFVTEIIGINIVSYTLYLYPLVACVLIAVLSYFFAAKVFGAKAGFLAMLFTLPMWHYIEPHGSPFSLGTILVLLTLVLMTCKSRLAFVLSFFTAIVVVLTHPISPISLGSFMFACFFVGFFLRRYQGKSLVFSKDTSLSILLSLGIIWFLWTLNIAINSYQGVKTAFLSVLNLNFLDRILNVSQFAVGGQGFIFPEIHTLSLVIYGFFLVIIMFPLFEYLMHRLLVEQSLISIETLSKIFRALWIGVSSISVIWFLYWIFYDVIVWNKTLSQLRVTNYIGLILSTVLAILGAVLGRQGIFEKLKTTFAQLNYTFYDKIILSFAAFMNALVGVFLFLSSGERFLLGRGLLYFLFFGSMVFATYFLKSSQFGSKVRKVVALSLVVFLFCSFPVISYSKEAYNSFTPSAEAGLTYLSSNVDLSKNSLSMGVDQQLASYIDLSKDFVSVPFPPNLTYEYPDVIVLRINTYYIISMRYDLSFTDNSYIRLEEKLEMNSDYNKIYSNGRFEIFVHSD